MPDKIKVAILGGGMGSLAAAWKLTETQAGRDAYEITVYQRDWLLGGKGASTRNQAPNRGLRIEEHGIHLLLGFYNKALRLLRSVYDELAGTPGVPPFDDLIEPWNWVWLADEHPVGAWQPPWRVEFPSDPSVVPGQSGVVPGTAELLKKAASRFADALSQLIGLTGSQAPAISQAAASLGALIDNSLTALALLPRPLVTSFFDFTANVVDSLVQMAWPLASPLLHLPQVRHAWISVFLLGTNISGALKDRVPLDGTDPIDVHDYRAWLASHSAVPAAPPHVSWESPPVRALYDLAFSRVAGLAAGVSLGAIARMVLGYEGHFTYKMKAGMGEVVFSPLYLALDQRGVKFCFFHEVSELIAVPDGSDYVIDEIRIDAPAGTDGYVPTFQTSGNDAVDLHAWPAAPPDLTDAPKSLTTLRRGVDFHVVVLGIPAPGLDSAMVGSLRTARPRFAQMIDHASHVATQSIQLWMTKTGAELGWTDPHDAMLISYARPFNSWVDMSHLRPKEGHPALVNSIHYLCDELRVGEGTTPADVKANAIAWITSKGAYAWPTFTWADLHDPTGSTGSARMDFQYFRANRIGSERYVTVGPDSVRHRLAPGASGFRNLALAGDWVRTELNAGCLEAATTGGLGAGEAILAGIVHS